MSKKNERKRSWLGVAARLLVLVILLGPEPGCDSESKPGDVTSEDGIADSPADDVAAGPDVVSDAVGIDAEADESDPGDPEFAAYCQGIVDAFRALYENLELPDNLAQENPPPMKTGEEFDPNDFFAVLDRLHMEEGWTLDFVYTYASDMGGEATLVARTTDSPLCQSDPESPCVQESYMDHLLLDGSREAWFQLQVLRLMARELYCDWHGCGNTIILPSQEGLQAWMESQAKHLEPGADNGSDEAAIGALVVDPVVELHDDRVQIEFVWFSRWSGVVRSVRSSATAPPYSTAAEGENYEETLFECTWCPVP